MYTLDLTFGTKKTAIQGDKIGDVKKQAIEILTKCKDEEASKAIKMIKSNQMFFRLGFGYIACQLTKD